MQEPNSSSSHDKISMWTAMVFVAGGLAGGGVLALPKAVENSGWIGLVLILMTCIACGWCGILLGKCWLILEERHSKYQEQCRDPYPSIGYECFGRPGQAMVSISLNSSYIGSAIVFLILAAQNFHEMFYPISVLRFSSCFWMIIIAVTVTPIIWLGTPKDFWPLAFGALLASALAGLILIGAICTYPVSLKPSEVEHKEVTVMSLAMSFGTILFGCGGAGMFPTIQHDMHNTTDFPKAVLLGYIILFLIYFPLSATGYLFLGHTLTDNILQVLDQRGGKTWIYYTTQVMICTHLLPAFIMLLNPPCQELEKLVRIPLNFTWKRAVLRSGVVALVLFVSESVPRFGPILALIGASDMALLSIIFPCVFYLKLCSMKNSSWPIRKASLHERTFCIEMVIIAVIAGVISSYSAVAALVHPSTFLPPCYINTTIDVL